MIKALIIEDSGLMRLRIRDILSSDRSIRVVATAGNGAEGVAAIQSEKPDVVITDMVMPEFDGLYVVREAMSLCPVPIIVLSSLEKTNSKIFEALESGAVAFLDKPKSSRGLGFNKPLIELVKAAAEVDIATLSNRNGYRSRSMLEHVFSKELLYDVVAIGASTGGPGAVEIFIKGLPSTFPVPIIIVQHMPERFLISFTKRLDTYTRHSVLLARRGEVLKPNHIYVCPGELNTRLVKDKAQNRVLFGKSDRQYTEFNGPSVDCLFESVAQVYGCRGIGVLLTGMGKDGAEGMKRIKDQGGLTVAQSEKTSVVFGMPKAAIDIKAADYVLDIGEIPGFVTSCFS